MTQSTQPLEPCNICGNTAFQPGPLKRMANTGRLPCCMKCGGLERHRIARRIMDLLPQALLAERKMLQFSRDDSVNPSRVGELRVSEYGSADSLDIQAIAAPDGSYDWVISHHVVNFVPDDSRALKEMLRVAGPRGAVLITVGGTTDNFDTRVFEEPTGPHAAYKIYGSDFAERIAAAAPEANVLELIGSDPCTGTIDVVFIYSRQADLLREIGRVLMAQNVLARFSGAPAEPQTAPAAATPAPASGAATPAPGASATSSNAVVNADSPGWQPLIDELGEWKKLGQRPRFWIRDDDAVAASARLTALWQVCADNEITLACAAIPHALDPSLAEWARQRHWLVMLQHGFDHVNRSTTSDSSEFPDTRDVSDAVRSIQLGQERMTCFGSKRLPIFVPPWGRLSTTVTSKLASLGYSGVSASYLRQAPREYGLTVANTHVLIPRKTSGDWVFEIDTAVSQLVTVLSAMRARGDRDPLESVGINTHHLSVGPTELAALDALVRVTRQCGSDWLHPAHVFGIA